MKSKIDFAGAKPLVFKSFGDGPSANRKWIKPSEMAKIMEQARPKNPAPPKGPAAGPAQAQQPPGSASAPAGPPQQPPEPGDMARRLERAAAEAWQKGFDQANEQAQAQIDQLRESLRPLLDAACSPFGHGDDEFAAKLCIEKVKSILRCLLLPTAPLGPHVWAALLEPLREQLSRESARRRLRVNPADLPGAAEALEKLGFAGADLVPDETLPQGSARAELESCEMALDFDEMAKSALEAVNLWRG